MRWEASKRRTATALAAACLTGLAVAGAALGAIVVYTNNFQNKSAAHEIQSAGGKHCDREWRNATATFLVTVKRGPEACGYRPAVQSDGHRPDYDFKARARVLKDTRKSVRDSAYVAVSVRNSPSSGYELRVFPKGKRFSLKRDPSGGPFPEGGTSNAIKRINQSNVLELRAFGNRVKAFVNRTKVAEVTDPNPREVGGRRVAFLAGDTERSKRDVLAIFDSLRLSCPRGGC